MLLRRLGFSNGIGVDDAAGGDILKVEMERTVSEKEMDEEVAGEKTDT